MTAFKVYKSPQKREREREREREEEEEEEDKPDCNFL
jgi:hypothetical protein